MRQLAKRIGQVALLQPIWAMAADRPGFGFQTPQTVIARQIVDLHALMLGICIVIAVVVFGVMFYSIVRFRKTAGREAKQFHSNTTLEIMWTVIPCLIVAGMAYPATKTVIEMKDTTNPDMTIKITGYQWKWRYTYVDDGIDFYSSLSTPRDQIENEAPKGEHYLLEVDHPLVVPVGKKIRILTTADDVIHSWFVPALAVKQDAVPGFVRDSWFRVDAPGIYRGACTELCGKEHGFMPVVVEAMPEKDYADWVADQHTKSAATAAANAAAAGKTETLSELTTEGQKVYERNCVACHQANGQGLPPAFPALAHSKVATGPIAAHVDIVMNGSKKNPAMAAWKGQLSDAQIAAVITYERNAFGNSLGDLVQPQVIAAARQ